MTRILVVEDEPSIALGLLTDLSVEGYEVEVSSDGETGARRARETAFDLILLDVMLPRQDGFTVSRELRRAGVKTPIILRLADQKARSTFERFANEFTDQKEAAEARNRLATLRTPQTSGSGMVMKEVSFEQGRQWTAVSYDGRYALIDGGNTGAILHDLASNRDRTLTNVRARGSIPPSPEMGTTWLITR